MRYASVMCLLVKAHQSRKLMHQRRLSTGRGTDDPAKWRDDVREFWFGRYSRSAGAVNDSTGFEHVFQVTEPRDVTLS